MSKCSEQELQKAISDEESVRGKLQAELAANKRHCRKLLSEARAAQYSGLLAELKQVSQSATLTPIARLAKIKEIECRAINVFSPND